MYYFNVKTFRSPWKKKILLLLKDGVTLMATRSVSRQGYLLRKLHREWKNIDKNYLWRVIKEFKHDRLVEYREHPNGLISIILTEEGKKRSLKFNVDSLTIPKPTIWNHCWHLVFFDVPEKKRRGRDALRLKLRELGFYEWQKSVFVHPYPCRDQIDFVVEFFELRPFVRYGDLSNPTNEAELKLHFNLS